jgi:hypothetical protein
MQQRSIVAYFALKGLPAREVYDDLEVTLELDALTHNSVLRYPREARFLLSSAGPLWSTCQWVLSITIRLFYLLSKIVPLG